MSAEIKQFPSMDMQPRWQQDEHGWLIKFNQSQLRFNFDGSIVLLAGRNQIKVCEQNIQCQAKQVNIQASEQLTQTSPHIALNNPDKPS